MNQPHCPPPYRTAIDRALRAPSLHNSQPWRWSSRPGHVELYADLSRHLPWTDPDRRDLLLSCGAALHHLRVALAGQGYGVQVHRLADPDDEWHLATVDVFEDGRNLDVHDQALAPSIAIRRTERRRMSRRTVPDELVTVLGEAARREDAALFSVSEPRLRSRLVTAVAEAAARQRTSPGYAAELAMWTHRYAGSGDGVSARNVAVPSSGGEIEAPLRTFAETELTQPHRDVSSWGTDDGARLLVLTTAGDDRMARLRGGEALSSVLLTATGLGLATTPLSQATEIATVREYIRREIVQTGVHPHILLRIGWPAENSPPPPPADRRPVNRVLAH